MLNTCGTGLEVVEDCLVWIVGVGDLVSASSKESLAYLFHELTTADDGERRQVDPVG
jgi:hypothetical protein